MPEEAVVEGSLITETQKETPWYSEDYKDLVAQQGWKDPNDPVRDYAELQKMASGKVKIPGEDASPEERSSFYAKIGRPDTPEGYEITDIPEDVGMTEELLNELRKDAFEIGTPKVMFETVLKNHLNRLSEAMKQDDEKRVETVREEWKDDYDANHEIAERYVAEHCSDEVKQFLVDARLDNHPVFVKHFFEQGKKTLSDSLVKGSQDSGEKEADYTPQYPNSPDMYRNAEGEEGKRARAWFERVKGHVY